ncbi:DNA-directed RNA polymerase subunit delta [Anaerobacillus isosaccharinicus]|uniref:Probable DNA-directed RNA polymerase subunit delta n=1 Tax=Anaerobacillus isosaccharinicus TaxID=1532552 RepID=A0A1S2L1R2_9BACI|nr:DNA-directed RNA polymerase subunit delta [Anaerobacillus isosaccharinicus]MBA5584337.1 DNA-directed RNA polymerase subunit delta [Anaerobacillus isosaccharinicus]QOY37265.1 DNA-directed RNA polymerase subunit delta [Anaerobacillus isosaccharinicus]
MTLNEYTPEEIKEMSMVEIAFELMQDEKQPFVYGDLVKRVAEIKGMSENEVLDRIAYLYTDLNVDGRFICLGENRWGLRTWYPYEQAEEEVTQTVKRKKAKKKGDDDDLDTDLDEDFDDLEEELDDEFEDLEDELDELVSDEDDDEDVDIDLDDDDVDADDEEEPELEEDDEDDLL